MYNHDESSLYPMGTSDTDPLPRDCDPVHVSVSGRAHACRCPNCGCEYMLFSGTRDNPHEITREFVRCAECYWITDTHESAGAYTSAHTHKH